MGGRAGGDQTHRVGVVLGLAILSGLVWPAAAGAHLRSGKVAVDYRATISTAPDGVQARVYPTDLALRLTAVRGHEVVVLGYTGEPAIRLDDAGVAANERSLTAAGSGLLKHSAPGAGAPRWRLVSSSHSVVWHDARLHGIPPGTSRRGWSVPLVVDGARTSLGGELVRVSRPSRWPWAVLGLATLALVAAVLRLRSPRLLRAGAIWLGVVAAAATLATALAFALGANASQGAWLEGANELVFALVGLAFLVRGSLDTRALAGGALGMLALAVGLSRFPVFLHGIVLSAFPGELSRATVALSICAGGAAFVLGLMVFVDLLEHYEEPDDLPTSAGGSAAGR